MSDAQPLGVRLNNPCNVRATSDRWDGQTGERDGFVEFSHPCYGFRAAGIILLAYQDRGLKTYFDFFKEWAPVSDGNYPWSYAIMVSSHLFPSSESSKADFVAPDYANLLVPDLRFGNWLETMLSIINIIEQGQQWAGSGIDCHGGAELARAVRPAAGC